jgi:hypothetical protein
MVEPEYPAQTFLLLQIIHKYGKSPPRNPGLFAPELDRD